MTTPGSDRSRDAGEEPASTSATSAFDEARDLLQAALDDIRSDTVAKPPKPPAAAEAAPSKTVTTPPAVSPTSGAKPRPPARKSTAPPSTTGPSTQVDADELWPDPGSRPAAGASTRRARNRRRAQVAAATAATAAVAGNDAATDDLDNLGETLYQPSRKRRRRPAETTEATAEVTPAVVPEAAGLAPTPATREPEPQAPRESPAVRSAAAAAWAAPAGADEPSPAGTDRGVLDSEAAAPAAEPVETIHPVETVETVETEPTAHTAVVPISAAPATPADARSRKGLWIAAAAAALIAVLVVAVIVVPGGDSDGPALRAGGVARLTLPATTTAEGAEVDRVWTLQGNRGDEFVGTVTVTNPTSAPLATSVTEIIPKAVAASVDDIDFEPQPIVVEADPVVRYDVVVPANGTFTARYEVQVAPDGANRSRLERWAESLDAPPVTTTTTAPPVAPTTQPPTPATTPRTPATNPTTNPTRAPVPPPTDPPAPPPAAPATIIIEAFSAKGVGTFGYSTPVGAISLTAGAPDGSGSASWSTTVDPGSYTLSQVSTPAGFHLNSIECSTPSGSSNSFTVGAGETAFCRFVNVPA